MSDKEDTNTSQADKADAARSVDGDGSRARLYQEIEELNPPRVVYRRAELTETNAHGPLSTPPLKSMWTRQLSPAIVPLVVGFLLLIILIAVLGLLSVRRMDEVGGAVLDLEQQHAAKFSLLLRLRLALTKLDNEARARAEAEARRELMPPFDMRLNSSSTLSIAIFTMSLAVPCIGMLIASRSAARRIFALRSLMPGRGRMRP